METKIVPPRRARDSNVPLPGRERPLKDHDLTEFHYRILAELEPSLHSQVLTTAWLHHRAGGENYLRTVKRCALLRENGYIDVPEMWHSSPNTAYKHYAYQITDKGARINAGRGVPSLKSAHRSNSYYHEFNCDNGYYAPLRYFVHQHSDMQLISAEQLLTHQNVPRATRENLDPFGYVLKSGKARRFDGTPHVLQRRKSIGIPGIEHDRNSEGNTSDDIARTTLGSHLTEIFEYISRKCYLKQYGFDNCFVPILLADRRYDREGRTQNRMNRVMKWVEKEFGSSPHLLFKQIPDLAMLKHFPEPKHYNPTWSPENIRNTDKLEWLPPPSIHVFTTPWKRVGYPDFSFDTFDA